MQINASAICLHEGWIGRDEVKNSPAAHKASRQGAGYYGLGQPF